MTDALTKRDRKKILSEKNQFLKPNSENLVLLSWDQFSLQRIVSDKIEVTLICHD